MQKWPDTCRYCPPQRLLVRSVSSMAISARVRSMRSRKLSRPTRFRALERLDSISNGLRRLKDPNLLNFTPTEIRVVATLRDFEHAITVGGLDLRHSVFLLHDEPGPFMENIPPLENQLVPNGLHLRV